MKNLPTLNHMPTLSSRRLLSPFEMLDVFDSFFDSFPDSTTSISNHRKNMPAANIMNTAEGHEIEIALPGLSRSDIDLSIDNGVLTISSAKVAENDAKSDNYTRREFGYTSFSRSWTLPKTTSYEGITARFDAGILSVSIPVEDATSRSVRSIQID